MALYNDIYMRDALDDNGSIPYNGATIYLSPDIIPAQQQVISQGTLINSYGTNPTNTNINAQQLNNIYVRAKNLASSPGSGTIQLYYAPSSLLLTPSQWVNNPIQTAGGQTFVNVVGANGASPIAASAVGAGSSAFAFSAPAVPQGYHYCMIGQVITAAHPNAIPSSFASSGAFVAWVVNNPAICWRNVNIVAAGLPAWQQGAAYANLDPTAEQYMWIVAGTNWPANTSVNIQSTTAGCVFSYTQSFGSAPQTVTTIQTVPASFNGSSIATVTPPAGVPIPPTATVTLTYARYTSDADEDLLRRYARPAYDFGIRGNLATAQVVRMGECFVFGSS